MAKQLIEEKPYKRVEPKAVKLSMQVQTDDGREIPDSTPMEPPIGYVKQPSMIEIVRAQVMAHHRALQELAAAQEKESFEEADDFDVGDDFDPHSPYEGDFDKLDEETIQALSGRRVGTALSDEQIAERMGWTARPQPRSRQAPSKQPQPGEGGEERGSPNDAPDDPPGTLQRVREYVRRKPGQGDPQ